MTDAEFNTLRPCNNVSVSGKQIAIDALVTHTHNCTAPLILDT